MPVEGRGLSSRWTQQVERDRRLGNLSTPITVQKLQTALHAKAKSQAGYRFYALYDKIYRSDVATRLQTETASSLDLPRHISTLPIEVSRHENCYVFTRR